MPEQGGGGKRKKKPLDAVINVVPAIDLLSCCISFLLFTAVWTQISRLQVQLLVTLAMGERGFTVATSSGSSFDIPALGRGEKGEIRFDLKALGERLKQLKGDYPDTSAITVSAEDTVSYGDLVQVIDACVGSGLAAVSVTGV